MVTLTAMPATVAPGEGSNLTLTLPTLDFHNLSINGLPPAGTGLVRTLTVNPTVTTVYQSKATNTAGTPLTMPAVTVAVAVPPAIPKTQTQTVTVTYADGKVVTFGIQVPSDATVVVTGP